MHNAKQVNPIMKFFDYEHLPEQLQAVSKPIGDLARLMEDMMPDSAEKSAGLRKLLEAKDCMVRAALGKTLNPVLPKRTVFHVTAGNADWDPSQEDVNFLRDMFLEASFDPLGAVVVTRNGITCSAIEVSGNAEVQVVKVQIEDPSTIK